MNSIRYMNDYTSLFSSLNGSYDFNSAMSSVLLQRTQLTNGSYAKLMKAYVNKVGNASALKSFQESGTTVNDLSDSSDSSLDMLV